MPSLTALQGPKRAEFAPKYRQLELLIRERIEDREWLPGDQIPTEAQLCQLYQVSKTTVRAAIDELVLAGLLERVQGSGTFVVETGQRTVLTLVGWGPAEKSFVSIWRDIQREFAAVYPHLDLKVIGIPYVRLREWLVEHVAQGTAPDIAQIDSAWDMEFAALGYTQPLDDLISAKAREEVLPALLGLSTYRGMIQAWPEAPMPFCLYCNRRLRDLAGFERAPETLDELAEQARAIAALSRTSSAQRVWGLTLDTHQWVWGGNSFLPILYNFGGSEMDEDGRITVDSDACLAALQWCRSLVEEGVLGPLDMSVLQARKVFGQRATGFYVDHPGARPVARRHSGLGQRFDDEIEVVPFPRHKLPEHKSIVAMWDFIVFRQSRRQREAALFLEWVTGDPGIAGRYFNVTGGLPITVSSLQLAEYQDRFAIPTLRQIETARRPFAARPDKQDELANILAFMVRAVLLDGVAPKDALREAARMMRFIVRDYPVSGACPRQELTGALWRT